MCGIAGQLAFPTADAEGVRRATAALAHRGPDGDGFHADGPIALGHRRLSIIDLATGGQPMFAACDGGDRLAIVFNGEIYNYKELRAGLSARHRLATASDTEVLLHLYEDKGERMVEDLRGMFAFALWDGRRQRLFCARDRFGEKPFYYSTAGGAFTFASEPGALRAAGVALGEIDFAALSDYLELLYVPAPRTIWKGVHKLPAGHALTASREGVEVRRYWSPPVPGSEAVTEPHPPAGQGTRLREELREAVRLRLRSDVPIAALLSGGLDSATVVALMAQELGPGVKTFTVGFGEGSDDELPLARLVAERWRTDHHEIAVTGDLLSRATEAVAAYGEPFGDSSSVPTVAVCKAVAREVKVVLTGDGGDELFAGYGTYRKLARWPRVPLLAPLERALEAAPEIEWAERGRSRAARALGFATRSGAARQRALIQVFNAAERAVLLRARPRVAAGSDVETHRDADAALAFDLGVYLPDDLLVKMDTASMRFGLEARCPLLDDPLAQLAVPPPIGQKVDRHRGKLLLRAAVADLIPDQILAQPKRGFGSPVGPWLAGPLRPLVEDALLPPSARLKAWLDGRAVDRVARAAIEGRGNPHQAWALLSLELWARRAV